jgi:hypothetical protein
MLGLSWWRGSRAQPQISEPALAVHCVYQRQPHGKDGGRRTVRRDGVVVVLPDRQGGAHVGEDGLVEQLVTQSSVEAFDGGILLRCAWRDVVPSNLHRL